MAGIRRHLIFLVVAAACGVVVPVTAPAATGAPGTDRPDPTGESRTQDRRPLLERVVQSLLDWHMRAAISQRPLVLRRLDLTNRPATRRRRRRTAGVAPRPDHRKPAPVDHIRRQDRLLTERSHPVRTWRPVRRGRHTSRRRQRGDGIRPRHTPARTDSRRARRRVTRHRPDKPCAESLSHHKIRLRPPPCRRPHKLAQSAPTARRSPRRP